ncbi:hypothetical protein [Cellulomonas sp. ATA003]|uniref:hypothetical protein n=1 Tax=Cellulomonas sp. ATA003 TaxID=3073064 RepID=UPI0028739D33|nr:hypothetical protein [Cellulomonas sp. ATA003]WNB85171.1 hypothetical protein REH70_16255 [Cellulomonas sp. ATA003]
MASAARAAAVSAEVSTAGRLADAVSVPGAAPAGAAMVETTRPAEAAATAVRRPTTAIEPVAAFARSVRG